MSLEFLYSSLWDVMERDFDSQLDADSFEQFSQNVGFWAGDHGSDATKAVALEIWNQLHEDEPPLEVDTGYEIQGALRQTATGQFASPRIIDSLIIQNFVDETAEAAAEEIIQEEIAGEEATP